MRHDAQMFIDLVNAACDTGSVEHLAKMAENRVRHALAEYEVNVKLERSPGNIEDIATCLSEAAHWARLWKECGYRM